MKHHHKHHGFTLLEMLLVITLIGILGAIASIPYRKYKQTTDVANAAQSFTFDLETTRSTAKRLNSARMITIDTTNNTYTITDTLTPPSTTTTKTLPSNVRISSGTNTTSITFYPPYGTVLAPNGVSDGNLRTFTFTSTQNNTIQKNVNVIGIIGTVINK